MLRKNIILLYHLSIDIPAINTDKAATPHKEVYNQKEQPSQNGDHSQTRPHQSMEFKRTKSTFQGSTRNADGVSTNSLTSSKSSRSDGYSEEVEPSEKYIDEYTSVINLITTYKKYIINTVVPLIIILLLILLMKYKALRIIFTKIKRKKQNDMNEKLQRVLQQPSNGSEQRRIPFSYSAFEYSS
ncbi:PIR protein [Plasmodium vivax]|uniref:VIR protein n=1 Tax=Plasmodium vivax TaxID=5855 RepID=A0A565A6L4_PLAVI|nr:PIR protein [Plasmodium vivax]